MQGEWDIPQYLGGAQAFLPVDGDRPVSLPRFRVLFHNFLKEWLSKQAEMLIFVYIDL